MRRTVGCSLDEREIHAGRGPNRASTRDVASLNSWMRSSRAEAASTSSATAIGTGDADDLGHLAAAGREAGEPRSMTCAATPIDRGGDGDLRERHGDAPAVEPAEPASQQPEQHDGVEDRGDRGAERQPLEAEHAHQHEVQRQVHADREHTDDDRACGCRAASRRSARRSSRPSSRSGPARRTSAPPRCRWCRLDVNISRS